VGKGQQHHNADPHRACDCKSDASIDEDDASDPEDRQDESVEDAFRARMEQGMAPVAQLFGTTAGELMHDVQASGGSLADYAASKGISKDALIDAIKSGLQANTPNGMPMSDSQFTTLANRIADHKPGDRPQGPPPSDGCTGVGSPSSSGASEIKTDLEKLTNDLKESLSASDTSSEDSDSNGVSALLELLTRFDQRL
jgi:hypothetical protein